MGSTYFVIGILALAFSIFGVVMAKSWLSLGLSVLVALLGVFEALLGLSILGKI